MYKLLIVDDEEIEREGMASLIPWSTYQVEVVGTAWNGLEAWNFIQRFEPDVVLTDIKMPVMNGLELIRTTRSQYPDIEFIVLSGYGDFEFTSQAMEEGIQYYVLKPCDEARIVSVLEKVKEKIERRRSQQKSKREYEKKLTRLLPRAREQILRNVLLGKTAAPEDFQLLQNDLRDTAGAFQLLAVRRSREFDYLERFVIGNMLGDLLPAGILLMDTMLEGDSLLLLRGCAKRDLDWAASWIRREFAKRDSGTLFFAVSRPVPMERLGDAYEEVQTLLKAGGETEGVMDWEQFSSGTAGTEELFDYHGMKEAKTYEKLLFELTLACLKMKRRGMGMQEQTETAETALRLALGVRAKLPKGEEEKDRRQLLAAVVQAAAPELAKEDERELLVSCYGLADSPKASVAFLAKQVLFISEGYFSRQFAAMTGQKFSTWLEETRIGLARRLWEFDPNLRVGELAELVGYAPDGQYFSKAFRKITGYTPSEYRGMRKLEQA